MEHGETFYFIAYCDADRKAITVIDLAHCVDYERSDWRVVNAQNFSTSGEAIRYAKVLARKYALRYAPFESRYDKELNETSNLTIRS